MYDAHVWHEGNLIKVGRDAGGAVAPLDAEVVALLTEHMEYDQIEHLYGHDVFYNDMGERQRVRVHHKRLWCPDSDGLLICGAGYLDFVVEKLGNLGYKVGYKRIVHDTPRPDAFVFDYDAAVARYTFRPRQEECFMAIVEHILAGRNGVIDATVGFGKSDLIVPVSMAFPNADVVVIVRTIDAVKKTYDKFREYLPSVGMYYGNCHQSGHRIMVYSADSIGHWDGDADIVFVDEVHELLADKYAILMGERLAHGSCRAAIAMTATTDSRSDGNDARLEAWFGRTFFYLGYAEAERLGLVVPIRVYIHPVPTRRNPVEGVESDVARKRRGIWAHRARNEVIAGVALAYRPEEQVLILVDTIEHMLCLRKFLPEYTCVWSAVKGEDLAYYRKQRMWDDYEKMTDRRRGKIVEDFRDGRIKKAIATVWKAAMSFNSLQAVIWAAAGASKTKATQAPGRVSRPDPKTGKFYGEVHDFDDKFDDGLADNSETRIRYYRKHGWEIIRVGELLPA
jgi:superfamily II DNA or RNA helicase